MARGLTAKQIYDREYRRLHRFVKKLNDAGIKALYEKRAIYGTVNGVSYSAWYRWGNMSNGETVGQFMVSSSDPEVSALVKNTIRG